ncbi:MAG: hypothetical protein AB7L71_06170 [Vicinamibacterales bacterium]
MTRRPALTLAVIAAVLTLAQHWPALQVQFWVDEFSELRPWTRAEIWQALTGPWDPSGASEPYYRPLASLYYAASFEFFGFHPAPLHAISLALTAIAAWLLGLFAWRESGRPVIGIAAAVLFILHPALIDAALAPTKLHPSLIGCVITAASLLLWQQRRTRRAVAWWPIWALVLLYAGFKEDAVMIAPALVALQWVHARWWNGPRVRAGVVVMAVALPVAVTVARMLLVPTEGLSPTLESLVREGLYGPYHTMVKVLITAPIHTQFVVHWPSSVVVSLLTAAAIIALLRRPDDQASRIFVSGIVLMAILGAPLALISGPTRVHLVVFAAALALAGAAGQLWQWAATTWPRIVVTAMACLALASGSRQNLEAFAPCSPLEPEGITATLTLPSLSSDLRSFLAHRDRACEVGDSRTPLDAAGILRWPSADRTVVLVSRHAVPGRLTVTHADGRVAHVELPRQPAWRRWLLGGDRVVLEHLDGPIEVTLSAQRP